MAQDTTPAIEVYQGDGSNNTFSVHFDKGYYGEIKVAFVKRGLTDYEYDPDTYEVSGRLYAWSAGNTTYYTHTPNPAIGATVYNEQDIDAGLSITEVSGITITVNNRAYARAQQHDIYNNVILTWTGDTLQVGDYICIVRETERGQPYELPINQKQIEGALDNIERQVQELKAKTDNALLVDPTRIADVSLMGPVQWMETILRSIDLSVRELRYYDGWLQYSLDDPKSASEDKTWYSLLNTTNIKSIYYKYTEDEQGRPLYNVYYVDNTDTERLLTYDAQAQRDDIDKLKQDVETNRQNIEAEKQVRREADENLRRYIDEKALQVDQFDGRITQNEEDITDIQSKIDPAASATDPLVPKSYVDNQLAGIYHIKGVVDTVNDLPTTGNTPGDCYNVLEDRQTYIWTEAEEWVATGEVVDLTPYRTADDQDVIDAGKQDKLTEGTYIEITNNNTINMTGKFGSSFDMNGKNLILKDQDGNTLDETLIGIGVDAEYTPAEEDIEFNESEGGDISFITERLNAIEEKIPDDASSSNKFATADDIGVGTLTIQINEEVAGTFNANAKEDQTINIDAPSSADNISYDNPDYPTVEAALNKLLYVAPSVTISGGGNYEIGTQISSVNLTWTWNKTIVSQSLNQGIGSLEPSVRTYTYNTTITTDTIFTITGSDGTNSKSASTSVKFMPKRYWGVSAKTSLTDAEIIALSNELSTTRQQKRTFDCSGGKYFYFAIKASYCNNIAFKVGGLSFSDMLVETRQFINASGHTDTYNIYRVNNIQTGSAIQVEVL